MTKIYILVSQTDYENLAVHGADLSETAARRWMKLSPYNDAMVAETGKVTDLEPLPYLTATEEES